MMGDIAKNGNVALEYSTDDGTTWNNLAGVVSFDPGVPTAESIDTTDYDSPGNYRETESGYKDYSDGQIVVNFDADDPSHVAMQAAEGGAAVKFRHKYVTKWLVISALVKSMSNPSSVGEILRSTIAIKRTGAPAWDAVA